MKKLIILIIAILIFPFFTHAAPATGCQALTCRLHSDETSCTTDVLCLWDPIGRCIDNICSNLILGQSTCESTSDAIDCVWVPEASLCVDEPAPGGTLQITEVPTGETMDVSAGISTGVVGKLLINGSYTPLNNFNATGTSINGEDLSGSITVGDSSVDIDTVIQLQSAVSSSPTVLVNSALPEASVSIPDGTVIMGEGWSGEFTLPTEGTLGGGDTAPSGFEIGDTIVDVGASDSILLFDRPVSLTLTGVNDNVGYRPHGSTVWQEITTVCDDYDTPTNITFPGECYVSNATNTRIWTYHFTSFAGLDTSSSPIVTPPSPIVSVVSTTSGGGGGGGGYSSGGLAISKVAGERSRNLGTFIANEDGEFTDDGDFVRMEYIVDDEKPSAPKSIVAKKANFLDVKGHWADKAISKLYSLNLIGGKTPTKFDPNASITRAEVVKISAMMHSNGKVDFAKKPKTKKYTDVDLNSWYAPYIEYAVENNLITGYGDKFYPNVLVARATSLITLMNGADMKINKGLSNSFIDVPNKLWFASYIANAKKVGIVFGYQDGTFRPSGAITRAEIAVITARLLDYVGSGN